MIIIITEGHFPVSGTVPGPVIFGAVTDTACLIWQDECGEPSSCWIYDTTAVSRNYFLISIAVKLLSITSFSLAYWLYKPPPPTDLELEKRDSAKRQMSFVNGSFRASEFEGNVLEQPEMTADIKSADDDKKTEL